MIPFLLLTIFVLFGSGHCGKSNPVVQTPTGAFRGKEVKVIGKSVHAFLGIPFAEPPIGNLRFKKPIPVKPSDKVYDATRQSPSCIQYKAIDFEWIALPPYSEDCLYLNVWVPQDDDKWNPEVKKQSKTVLAAFHGGGFYSGSAGKGEYDGKVLAAYGDVIVASFNYRSGVFGFLHANIEEAPGNMGLYDQVLALRWIKDNIKAFGGNPEEIVLLGASFASIGMHLISPISQDLFTRAIMQTNSPFQTVYKGNSQSKSPVIGDKFAASVLCSNDKKSLLSHPVEVVACLKNMDAMELARAESYFWRKHITWFGAIFGDEFLPLSPINAVRGGSFKPKDLISGLSVDPGAVFVMSKFPELFRQSKPPRLSIEDGRNLIRIMFLDMDFPFDDEISDRYLSSVDEREPGAVIQAVIKAFGDAFFQCPLVLHSEYQSDMQNKVFFYLFTQNTTRTWNQVSLKGDFPFTLGVPLINPSYSKGEEELSRLMMEAFSSFAKTGKPLLPHGAEWPQFDRKKQLYLELNTSPSIRRNPGAENCDFWDRNYH